MHFTQIFMRMGLPRVILSDNGKEFDNHLDSEVSKLLGIERRLTTPYHPQVSVHMHTILQLRPNVHNTAASIIYIHVDL